MKTVARTDVGRQRDHNEDSVLTTELDGGDHLLAVADGMGGHNAGDIASNIAVTEIQELVTREAPENPDYAEQVLREAARKADEEIRRLAQTNPKYEGMGTTLVAAIVLGEDAVVLNVGDSRAYHVNADGIARITEDHSLVGEMVRAGELTPDEARGHPQSNVITQALGTESDTDPDIYHVSLQHVLLLCSDGITAEIPDAEIHNVIMNAPDIETAGEQLIERANDYGGSDNITVGLGSISR